jgi:hypothetical protein
MMRKKHDDDAEEDAAADDVDEWERGLNKKKEL